MTPDLLVAATGCSPTNAGTYAEPLARAFELADLTTPERQAMFLANAAHESARFTSLTESLNYSIEGLLSGFGRHRISEMDARRYGRAPNRPANQEALANLLYGGAFGQKLGNVRAGDGWRFRGRGIFQITGGYNYARTRDGLRQLIGASVPDFVAHPELIAEPQGGCLAAGLYWRRNELNKYADRGNFDGCCDYINFGKLTPTYGDSKGFADRRALYARARTVLGA